MEENIVNAAEEEALASPPGRGAEAQRGGEGNAGAETSPLSLPDGSQLSRRESQGGEQFGEHIRSLARQGQALRASIPGFDLRRELSDPMFARLTSPHVGLSVEDAYFALHRRELQQAAARMAAGSISRSIQAGQLRPRENSGAQAGSVQTVDYSRATKEQREELKQAIRNASARGEKIYP